MVYEECRQVIVITFAIGSDSYIVILKIIIDEKNEEKDQQKLLKSKPV